MKRLAGNPGKRAIGATSTPQFPAAKNRAPHGLSGNARKYWHTLAHDLIEAGVLSIVDVPAFILMAEHYSLARRVMDELGELTTVDKNGAVRKSPLLQVFKDNAGAYRLFAAEFGLTPSSRSRLNIAPPDPRQMSLAEELFAMVGNMAVIDDDD
jgi:P27 family predicted phage terminase small subunit